MTRRGVARAMIAPRTPHPHILSRPFRAPERPENRMLRPKVATWGSGEPVSIQRLTRPKRLERPERLEMRTYACARVVPGVRGSCSQYALLRISGRSGRSGRAPPFLSALSAACKFGCVPFSGALCSFQAVRAVLFCKRINIWTIEQKKTQHLDKEGTRAWAVHGRKRSRWR